MQGKSPDPPSPAEPSLNQRAEILNHFLPEPIGSPLVRVLFTKGMIARGFSGRPDGYRIGHGLSNAPCEGALTGTPLPKLPSQHAVHGDGPPMVGLLRAIRRLDHGPVSVQADELATGDIPQQPGAAQSVDRALPVAAEQAHGVPAGRGGARGPVRRAGHESLAIADKLLPPVRRYISRCSAEVETGNAPDTLQENRVAFQTVVWGMVRLGQEMVKDFSTLVQRWFSG
jgi:hypothetical protein